MGLLTTSFTEELLLLNSGKGEISRVKYLSYVYIFFFVGFLTLPILWPRLGTGIVCTDACLFY